LIAALVRRLGIRGRILDVGCHAGLVSDCLYDLVDNEITGIDISKESIVVAEKMSGTRPRLRFKQETFPSPSPEKYELVIAVSSMMKLSKRRGDFISGIGAALQVGGVALIVSRHWRDVDMRELKRQLKTAGLGYGMGDIVGGLGDMPLQFDVEGCLILLKGSDRSVGRRFLDDMQSAWPEFREYANHGGAHPREKTVAFQRACSKVNLLPARKATSNA
jgi:SAM-dependent methyltransferase